MVETYKYYISFTHKVIFVDRLFKLELKFPMQNIYTFDVIGVDVGVTKCKN